VRSTFIVGFPGETEEDFRLLLDWLKEARIARAGCFKYEAVEGATANALPGAVPEAVKAERWHRFMAAQREVSRETMAARVGRSIDVIVDEVDENGAVGRSKWDAPEIDGAVFLNGVTSLKPGDIVQARVTNADEYDLWAELSPLAGRGLG
jgi:ribosomal protein S12 methylthiotransferase